ncbi:hypothetical protein M409DRAFT_26784 [Zasmidium cellare ATCC 36951]|uniref:Tachykinin family protein n=1 Tax=Zasmidium cellare ATCC 36951 TaxID=1080233 RepID=A0A6A6C7A9_ZASCE|nr:uncharacterized protein M409DRAFT_26784 [Zasmidium cellare ATCC 36951]KAF2162931.1 hypothetical protein M409DRAFT_26784 [Zasmidium cellare ATCC 36951]
MDPSQDAEPRGDVPKPAPLLFVDVGTSGKQRSKQSRAHVARVNRQRQRDERLKSEGAIRGYSSKLSSETSFNKSKTRLPNPDSRLSIRQKSDKARPTTASRRWNSAPTIPQLSRTPSPVFGALKVGSFDLEQSHHAADIADYCFNKVMNSWLDPGLKPTWFAAFFEHPLVFHCLSYSCGILQDVSSGRPVQQARLVHRLKTIQLVNQQLGNIDNVDPEPILLAITTLWRINTDQMGGVRAAPLIFTPHRRSASWVALFGKLGGDDTHSRAMVELVNRVGGMSNFTTLPSLQETLALGDVLHSSANASKPLFPSIWDAQVFVKVLKPSLQTLAGDVEGRGFVNQVPGGLPADALATFERLSLVDKLLDDFSAKSVSLSNDIILATLGDAVQHELLSLPSWPSLNEDDRHGCYLATYEVCRITAILYSNSVIFPMAPDASWLEKLLKQLRLVLETSNMSMWDDDTLPMLVWSLFIAGMAAFWTRHRSFFVTHLRSTLVLAGVSSLEAVKAMIRVFLWRDDACGHGADMLWDLVRWKEITS